MNDSLPPSQNQPSDWNWRALKRSANDRQIAGVCGGFGESTPIPSWLWRVLFLTVLLFGGLSLITYIILWICMPPADVDTGIV